MQLNNIERLESADSIDIDIQEEPNLIEYTTNHFNNVTDMYLSDG